MTRLIKEMLIITSGIVAVIYLIMPSLLPDFIPFLGWLDEGAATLTLVNVLNYYGLDLTNLYGSRNANKLIRRVRRVPTQSQPRREIVNEGPVQRG
jgi:uncharacterized membrane protein YkvA (DUF1232 family)